MDGVDAPQVEARNALIDTALAFGNHAKSLILVGAQALYFRTSEFKLPVAPATKDADFAIDSRSLQEAPLLEAMLFQAGFQRDKNNNNPGSWVSRQTHPLTSWFPRCSAQAGEGLLI